MMSLIHNIVPIRGLGRKRPPIPALRYASYGVRDNLVLRTLLVYGYTFLSKQHWVAACRDPTFGPKSEFCNTPSLSTWHYSMNTFSAFSILQTNKLSKSLSYV